MLEPDVALTDYAVALECAVFTWLSFRRRPFAIFFAAVGLGAIAGGTVHGYFPDDTAGAGAVLWRLALVLLGVAAYAGWSIGARRVFSDKTARIVEAIALVQLAVYAVVVVAFDQRFVVAIVNYAPSVVFLGIAFTVRPSVFGALGVALTVVAALIQRSPEALEGRLLDHNAAYHLVQMAALGLIFLAGRPPRRGAR